MDNGLFIRLILVGELFGVKIMIGFSNKLIPGLQIVDINKSLVGDDKFAIRVPLNR